MILTRPETYVIPDLVKKRAAKAKARMEAMLAFFVSRSAAESLHKLVR